MATDFGTDIAGVGDYDAALSFVSGERCLAEALANRLLSPPGSLIDDPDYGFGLRNLLNETLEDPSIYAPRLELELLKDERVRSARVELDYNQSTRKLTTTILVQTADGPFRFVVVATPSNYDILYGP